MNREKIKKTITSILDKLTVSFDNIEIIERGENSVVFMIHTSDDSQILIGGRGVNLSALNHIIKRLVENNDVSNRGENKTRFTVDVNLYQEKRNEDIKNKAVMFANRVKTFKSNIEMEPMTSYERMLVHSVLGDDEKIETESSGFGKERKVVIKFKE